MTLTAQPSTSVRGGRTQPKIIQGGMGVAVSNWRLARAVSQHGQLGVVSGTALDVVCARRLQDGDPGGHVRRALAAFPVPEVSQWLLDSYFVEGGIGPETAYRPVPRHTISSSARLVELTVAANFVEVYLAKEGHDGLVGMNYLRKIEMPLPASLYGAMLADVDYILMGAGSPAELPGMARALAKHQEVFLGIKVQGAPGDGPDGVRFDPASVLPRPTADLRVPKVIAIVASTALAAGLAGDPNSRPDGFVVEGQLAGGHNAPPRGPRRLDELSQPIYDERDEVDIRAIVDLGLPVWLAGSYGTPEGLTKALALGATGIQAGTVFAYSDEGGFEPSLKQQVRDGAVRGDLLVRSDWRVSPTGFPFRVAELPGTLSDPDVVESRQKVCDLGVLRSAYRTPDGTVDYRCPSEPTKVYLRKGGREANQEGRICLCNALLSAAGMPQHRRGGQVEPAVVTSGTDLTQVAELVRRSGERGGYDAAQVIAHLLGEDATQ